MTAAAPAPRLLLPLLAHAAVRSRRVFHSSAVFTASVTSASDDSSDAAANAADMLYSWNSFSTRSGRVSV
jgi:hypothetical protein